MKNKGFTLLETLVVSSFVITTLLIIFTQFYNLKNNYEDSFKYNTINGIYSTKNIEKFIKNNKKINVLTKEVEIKQLYILFFSDGMCNEKYVSNISYCNELINKLNVKNIYLTNEDLTEFKISLKDNNILSESLYQFIKKMSIKYNDQYRIIVEYNDDTYSMIETNFN